MYNVPVKLSWVGCVTPEDTVFSIAARYSNAIATELIMKKLNNPKETPVHTLVLHYMIPITTIDDEFYDKYQKEFEAAMEGETIYYQDLCRKLDKSLDEEELLRLLETALYLCVDKIRERNRNGKEKDR
jgi:hypothetical protein